MAIIVRVPLASELPDITPDQMKKLKKYIINILDILYIIIGK